MRGWWRYRQWRAMWQLSGKRRNRLVEGHPPARVSTQHDGWQASRLPVPDPNTADDGDEDYDDDGLVKGFDFHSYVTVLWYIEFYLSSVALQ